MLSNNCYRQDQQLYMGKQKQSASFMTPSGDYSQPGETGLKTLNQKTPRTTHCHAYIPQNPPKHPDAPS